MRQVLCISGPCSKDISVVSNIHYCDHLSIHSHMERTDTLNQSSTKVLKKTFEMKLLQICFVIEDFGSNLTVITRRNGWRFLVLKIWSDFDLDGFFYSKCFLNSQHQCLNWRRHSETGGAFFQRVMNPNSY